MSLALCLGYQNNISAHGEACLTIVTISVKTCLVCIGMCLEKTKFKKLVKLHVLQRKFYAMIN